jgi:hypothetical protein
MNSEFMQQESGIVPGANAVRSNSADLGRKENFANSAPNSLLREVLDEQNKQISGGRKLSPPLLLDSNGIADANSSLQAGSSSPVNFNQIASQLTSQAPIPTAHSNNPFRSTKKTQKTQK